MRTPFPHPRSSPWPLLLVLVATPAVMIAARSDPLGRTPAYAGASSDSVSVVATPVKGPSWLHRLGLLVSQTRMGQMGGEGPAPSTPRREPESQLGGPRGLHGAMRQFMNLFRSNRTEANKVFNEPFELTGADLYRLNCQSCHGPKGEGAPPEIHSLLDPVRATSAEGIQQQMAAKGRSISDDLARQLAAQSEQAIRDRLKNGGEKMPPFRHLRGDEVEALLGHLDQLAGVPAGQRANMLVPQSAARVGEHVVKGTCHICHDATGPGGHQTMMMEGLIPSLQSFPRDYTLNSVIHQVTYGSSHMMGMMGGGMMGGGTMMSGRGETMPALPYFTEEEIAAAYFYLSQYPPSD